MGPKSTLKATPPLELSRERRLRFSWQYRRFFDRAQMFRLSECLVYRISNECGHFRLGITLKSRGRSIDRNRVKRRIRESFRQMAPFLGGFDYNVVVPKTKKMDHPYPRRLGACLREELPRALARR
jgi:ribonuclease P protein component